MTNQKCCPECGKPTPGQQDGELCNECADKHYKRSNNWHDKHIGRTNGK